LMDLIVGFHRVDDMNTIVVLIDRCTKFAMFMVASTVCITEVAVELFY